MKIKMTLALAALCAFVALPALAQHGSHGTGAGANTHSSAGDSSHGNSADAKADKGSSNNTNSGSSVSERLTDNTKLASKLQGLLPANTNLQTAAQGFKDLGQFVAAVHVAHNLDIPFDQLKAKMMGPPKESLGAAIHALKPDANSKEESKKAEKQAKQDMDDTGKAS
jgi:hypothetical protein